MIQMIGGIIIHLSTVRIAVRVIRSFKMYRMIANIQQCLVLLCAMPVKRNTKIYATAVIMHSRMPVLDADRSCYCILTVQPNHYQGRSRLKKQGKIVAIKGIGGIHLACDAWNEQAIQRLRKRKMREQKPFAIMVQSIEEAKKFAVISREERDLLQGKERPIVLCRKKDPKQFLAISENQYNRALVALFASACFIDAATAGCCIDECESTR